MYDKACGFSSFTMVVYALLTAYVALSFLGCASVLSNSAIVNPDMKANNYALASNGGTITVSMPDGSEDTLINGITSSDRWNQGEGWKCTFHGSLLNSTRSTFRTDESRIKNTAMGWAIVELPKPMVINRVVIYTVDSERYPASKYGIRDLAIFYQERDDQPWFLVDPRAKRIGVKSGRIYGNVSGIIDYRIEPRLVKRVRVVVEETNDTKQLGPWGGYLYMDDHNWYSALARTVEGTVRLVEIEVYGTVSLDTQEPFSKGAF